jgi:hypothetical protein
MSPLTTTKDAAKLLALQVTPGTLQRLEIDLSEFHAVIFAIQVATPTVDERAFQDLVFDGAKSSWTLTTELRERTALELDAIASQDRRRQSYVLKRVMRDGRLSKIEGRGYADMLHTSIRSAASVRRGTTLRRWLRVEWVPTFTSPEQVIDYGLALLLDESRPSNRLFRRCQLESCRRFFIAQKPKRQGQFRYKYCSEEHQRAADAAKGAERVRRFRNKPRKPK